MCAVQDQAKRRRSSGSIASVESLSPPPGNFMSVATSSFLVTKWHISVSFDSCQYGQFHQCLLLPCVGIFWHHSTEWTFVELLFNVFETARGGDCGGMRGHPPIFRWGTTCSVPAPPPKKNSLKSLWFDAHTRILLISNHFYFRLHHTHLPLN